MVTRTRFNKYNNYNSNFLRRICIRINSKFKPAASISTKFILRLLKFNPIIKLNFSPQTKTSNDRKSVSNFTLGKMQVSKNLIKNISTPIHPPKIKRNKNLNLTKLDTIRQKRNKIKIFELSFYTFFFFSSPYF